MIEIKTALLSVFDKEKIIPLAQALVTKGVKIISSGGTAIHLQKNGIEVQEVSSLTGFPEMLEGRVKTLHPKIHGGILAKRTDAHLQQLAEAGINTIDLVVVNLYPFEKVKDENPDMDVLIENIDIGGPTLLRSAAKNQKYVCVLPSPEDYNDLLEEFNKNKMVSEKFARKMAIKTFTVTAYYDSLISQVLSAKSEMNIHSENDKFPLLLKKEAQLRYGENPFQQANLYKDGLLAANELSIVNCKQLWGKELSFNNYIDLDSALKMTMEFSSPFTCVLKHTNPCGAALGDSIEEAFDKAHSGDPKSAFGGIIGVNQKVTVPLAEKISTSFFECILAPGFEKKALEILQKKKNIRLLQWPDNYQRSGLDKWDIKKISGGFLVQELDTHFEQVKEWELKAGQPVSDEAELDFAWKMVKHVKSNAIILIKNRQLIGVGAGQMSRVDAVNNAMAKAKEFNFELEGAILSSDAFFPFPDSIETAFAEGVKIFIEPGGSIRDDQVIETAKKLGVSLYFTGYRHFKH